VSDHEFLFSLQLSDESHFDTMLSEVTRAVLTHVGYPTAAIDELRRALHKALASGAANGHRPCHVQFRAHSGELQILVAYEGGAEWRTSRALP